MPFFLIGICLLLVACDEPAQLNGHYEGSLFLHNVDKISKTPVSGDVSQVDKKDTLLVKGVDQHELLQISIELLDSDTLSLTIPETLDKPTMLKKNKDCFTGESDNKQIQLCTWDSALEITLNTQSGILFDLCLDHFAPPFQPKDETPKAYTAEEAINYSLDASFASRAEFQRNSQSHDLVREAWWDLAPQINQSTIGDVVTMNPIAMLADIGDFAPFLLPSRWMYVSQSHRWTDAERDAWILARANSGVTVAADVYVVSRDQAVVARLQRALDFVMELRPILASRIDAHIDGLDPSDLDDMDAFVDDLKLQKMDAEHSLNEHRETLAQAMGFTNPDAVSDITVADDSEGIAAAKAQDLEAMKATALDRSYELKQNDFLVVAAKSIKKSFDYWDWADPKSTPLAAFSQMANGSMIDSKPTVASLANSRNEVIAKIYKQTEDAVNTNNQTILEYPIATDMVNIEEHRLAKVADDLTHANNFDIESELNRVNDFLRAGVSLQNTLMNYRIANSQLDRLLLVGSFSKLNADIQ